jgi:two-component system, sensor histidine kinase
VNRRFVVGNYTLIVNFYSTLGMIGAALLPLAVHGHRSSADIYWSVSGSLTTAAIVIYGFNRLTSRNTALIVVSGCALGVSTVFLLPSFDWYSFARLALHIVVVNLVAFSLRETIERREREMFLLARDNLSKNIYAKELEAARAQAEEASEIKLRFLANMSHEFRTPMNGVLQTLDIVSRTASDDAQPLLQRARASGQALVSTLNSILEYTAWTQNVLTSDAIPVSVSESVRNVVQRHRDEASERGLGLVLRLDLASSEDTILLDRTKLEEALSRVLLNAVRFTNSGTVRVNVELRRRKLRPYPAAELEIMVADTGIGIPAELQEMVFNPFYQVDSASTRAVGGTGLGLAIARRLSEAMAGTIRLDSRLGVGTTIRLQFPTEIYKKGIRPLRSSRVIATPPALQHQALSGAVLLVEDNEFNAALVCELLTIMGLTVTRACDGQEAHRFACEQRYDVVLMDCQMPNVDGYESTRRIRTSEQSNGTARVPIIALTANALSGDRQKCLTAGMDDYLAKPYTASQLHAKLVTWLPRALTVSSEAAPESQPLGSAIRTSTSAG